MVKLFENLKFDAFYKAVIYLSGFILFTSLFVPTIYLPNYKVQALSFVGFIYGILAWQSEQVTLHVRTYKSGISHDYLRIVEKNHAAFQMVLFIIFILYYLNLLYLL